MLGSFFSSVAAESTAMDGELPPYGSDPYEKLLASDSEVLRKLSSIRRSLPPWKDLQSIRASRVKRLWPYWTLSRRHRNSWPWTILVMQKQETNNYLNALRFLCS